MITQGAASRGTPGDFVSLGFTRPGERLFSILDEAFLTVVTVDLARGYNRAGAALSPANPSSDGLSVSALSSWVRLLPGVQPDFLEAAEKLDAWHAELERCIARRAQELADLRGRLEDSRSRMAKVLASKWTGAQLQAAKEAASPAVKDGVGPTGAADLRPPSSTAHN